MPSPFAAHLTRKQGRELALGLEQGGWCPHLAANHRLRVGLDWRAWNTVLDALDMEDEPEPAELRRLWAALLLWAFAGRKPRERGDDYADRKLPAPTCARPGTAEKVLDMSDRESRGEALFHPQDAPLDNLGEARIPLPNPGNHANEDWLAVDERRHRLEMVAAETLKQRRKRQRKDYGNVTVREILACASDK